MTRRPHAPEPALDPAIGRAEHRLRVVRACASWLLRTRAVCLLLAWTIGVVALLALADYLLRTPALMRLVLLANGVILLAWGAKVFLLPALRFHPSLTEIALRVDRRPAASTGGLLASGVELAHDHRREPGDAVGAALRLSVLRELAARLTPDLGRGILNPRPALRALGALALVFVPVAAISIASPGLARTGAERILAPWSGAEWPRRFVVADATGREIHPADTALPVRAVVLRTTRGAGRTNVSVNYQVITGEGPNAERGPVRRVMLTGQGREVEVPGDPTSKGELYERLVEPGAFVRGADGAETLRRLVYWIETDDDRTVRRAVRLVDPPELERAEVVVEAPAYAAGAVEAGTATGLLAGTIDAGRGDDERALVGPLLAGSRVGLTLRFNKALDFGEGLPAWASPLEESAYDIEFDAYGRTAHLSARLERPVRLVVDVEDEHSLRPRDEIAFTFEVVQDRPPSAAVIEPARDETVLPTALVELGAEGRDDLALASLAIEQRIARPPGGSEGAGAEPIDENPAVVVRETFGSGPEDAGVREAALSGVLDLSTLGVAAGDEVWITAVAADSLGAFDESHGPARSPVRRLRVITETQFVEQIRSELAGLRRAAMRLDEQQAEIETGLAEHEDAADLGRAQSGLTDRLDDQEALVQRLDRRRTRNMLDDPALEAMLGEAGERLGRAEQASAEAAEALADADDNPEARERAEDAQRRVREQLGDLVALLDRGEDSWLARRSLERLAAEQRRLMEQTEEAGSRTVGRSADELGAEDRAELQRIAERQRELSERARSAIDDLSERGRELRERDAAQGAAMEEAARRGRDAGVEERLREAGEQVEQNQTGQAGERQQEALDAIEEMLEDMDAAGRNRDNVLRRVLSSLIESIEGLIERQIAELRALEGAVAGEAFAGLDQRMIRLSLNTLSVQDEATQGFAELRRVAELLGRAAGAQEGAVIALRADPVDAEAAEERERQSLVRLREALAEAQRVDREAEQREQERQRAELRRAYREALEKQVSLRSDAEAYVGRDLTRRDRAEIRGLGDAQDTLRRTLSDAVRSAEGLADARVFDLAHRRIDRAMERAAEPLQRGEAEDRVLREQDRAADILRALLDALRERRPDDNDFDRPEGDGGGGGGDGPGGGGDEPLIPPLAELQLLRAMQGQAAAVTRELSESTAPDLADLRDIVDLQRELHRRGAELIEQLDRQGRPRLPDADGEAPNNEGEEPEAPPATTEENR